MHSMRAWITTSRYLRLLPLTIIAAMPGCGGADGGANASTAGQGGIGNATSGAGGTGTSAGAGAVGTAGSGGTVGGGTANGGTAGAGIAGGATAGEGTVGGGGGSTASAGTGGAGIGGAGLAGGAGTPGAGGSTAGGGAGGIGSPASARSCNNDCAALANTECAGSDFSIATCVPQCQKAAQDGIDGAKAVGCLEQYLALDKCRANDPVCTHPNPNQCVQENAAYIQCLQDAAQ